MRSIRSLLGEGDPLKVFPIYNNEFKVSLLLHSCSTKDTLETGRRRSRDIWGKTRARDGPQSDGKGEDKRVYPGTRQSDSLTGTRLRPPRWVTLLLTETSTRTQV